MHWGLSFGEDNCNTICAAFLQNSSICPTKQTPHWLFCRQSAPLAQHCHTYFVHEKHIFSQLAACCYQWTASACWCLVVGETERPHFFLGFPLKVKRTNQTANSCTEVLSGTSSLVLPCYHKLIVLNQDNCFVPSTVFRNLHNLSRTYESFRENMKKLVPTLLWSTLSILLFSGPCQRALPMTRNVNRIPDTVAPKTTSTRVQFWPNKEVKSPNFPPNGYYLTWEMRTRF